jgi:hypothetical protein
MQRPLSDVRQGPWICTVEYMNERGGEGITGTEESRDVLM